MIPLAVETALLGLAGRVRGSVWVHSQTAC